MCWPLRLDLLQAPSSRAYLAAGNMLPASILNTAFQAHLAGHQVLPALLPCPPCLEPDQLLQALHDSAHPPYALPAQNVNIRHCSEPLLTCTCRTLCAGFHSVGKDLLFIRACYDTNAQSAIKYICPSWLCLHAADSGWPCAAYTIIAGVPC